MKISFIGAGKMAEALIARLRSSSFGGQARLFASDVDGKRLQYLKNKYRARIARSNVEAFLAGDIIILAVKPQQMAEVLDEISRACRQAGNAIRVTGNVKLVISIAAGIPLSYLQKKLPHYAVVRAMPNNPALVGEGITAIASGTRVSRIALRVTKQIFESVGEVVVVPEKLMDAVTGLSGSGPAYVYQMIEAMTEGGVKAGLPKKTAAKLATQTVLGAAATVKKTGRQPAELRAMVTSPGGTTLEGLKALDKRKFSQAVVEAVKAAAKKSTALSKKWAI